MNNDLYYYYEILKEDINKFHKNIIIEYAFVDSNMLKSILKRIVFIEYLKNYTDNYYFKMILSDSLYTIVGLEIKIERYSYLSIRSIIECFLRYYFKIEESLAANMRTLFTDFKGAIDDKEFLKKADKFHDVYSKSCMYVHGNSEAELSIIDKYHGLRQNNIKDEVINNIFEDLFFVLTFIIEFLIEYSPELIDGAFQRQKSTLEYLVGSSLKKMMLQNLEKR